MLKASKTFGLLALSCTMLAATACGSGNAGQSGEQAAPAASPSPSAPTEAPAAGGQKVKLRVVTITTDENRNRIMEEFIKPGLAEALPHIEVEFEPGGGGEDMANKLKTFNASGDMPDVFWSDAGYFTPLKSTGSIMDLTEAITKDGFIDKYAIPEALKHIDGKIYSISSGADAYFTPVIFYHKDLFEQAGVQVPATFDELIAVAKKLKDQGIVPAVTPGKDGWGPKLFLLQQMIQIGDPQAMIELVSNRTDFDNPSVRAGAARIERLGKGGGFPAGVANLGYGPAIEMFTAKKAAMYFMFTWELPNLAKDENVDFFPFPPASDKYDPNQYVQFWGSPVNGYAVSAHTKHPEEAVQLAEYLAMSDARFFESTGAPIALNTGNETAEPGPLMKKFIDWYNAIPTKIPSLALNSLDARTSAELSAQGALLLTGQYSAEMFSEQMNRIWKENTWFDQ